LPEQLIGADPDWYCLRGRRHLFDPEALAEYLRCFRNPRRATPSARTIAPARRSTVKWMKRTARPAAASPARCWRCGPGAIRSIKRMTCSRCGATGPTTWRGRAFDCGHYLPEEAPDETLAAFLEFFAP